MGLTPIGPQENVKKTPKKLKFAKFWLDFGISWGRYWYDPLKCKIEYESLSRSNYILYLKGTRNSSFDLFTENENK